MPSSARSLPIWNSIFFIASCCFPYSHGLMRCIRQTTMCLFVCFTGVASILAATPNQLTEEDKAGGWTLLFDGRTTQGWHSFKKPSFPEKGWAVEDGWLHALGKGGGDILSDRQFEQFDLEWEWKLASGGNSGVKYFVLETRNAPLGHEYQMIDEQREPDASHASGKRVTAAFYDVLKPSTKPHPKAPGEVNRSRIVVKGNKVEHWLNGEKVLDYSCGSEALKSAVAESKFKNVATFGERVKGHILLQEHGGQVWFRNLKIRKLAD